MFRLPLPSRYGDLLMSSAQPNTAPAVRSSDVLDLLETVAKKPQYSDATKRNTVVLEYIATALIKLAPRIPSETSRIREFLAEYDTHISPELQQRACEFQELLAPVWNADRAEIMARIPAMERVVKKEVGAV